MQINANFRSIIALDNLFYYIECWIKIISGTCGREYRIHEWMIYVGVLRIFEELRKIVRKFEFACKKKDKTV